MLNENLISRILPATSWTGDREWRDSCGEIFYIENSCSRLMLRAELPPGLYAGRIESRPGAFDWSHASMQHWRVPEMKKVAFGPWDFDHYRMVMAVPMAAFHCNGQLLGGLWFNLPGPDQLAQQIITADFGFEASSGQTELVLDIVEKDRAFFSWNSVALLEIRKDDRKPMELLPANHGHPRVYFTGKDLRRIRGLRRPMAMVESARKGLREGSIPWLIGQEGSRGTFDLGCLVWALSADREIGNRAKQEMMKLCGPQSWSTDRDPLVMGGDNDRRVGHSLYTIGVGWDSLQALLAPRERRAILRKADEYLLKIYDFTVLQKGYMGQPAPDAHNLGAWYGAGIASMAFYDEIATARRALPFFHGLMVESLALFPRSGKAQWATFHPIYLIRYLAAAHVFAGRLPELESSPFLTNLADALLACFHSPNSQELQRGLRTIEHRAITAVLTRLLPKSRARQAYETFVAEEIRQSGDLWPTFLDIIFAPESPSKPLPLRKGTFFARETGDIFPRFKGTECPLALRVKCGQRLSPDLTHRVMPHNREAPPALASVEMSWNGLPLLEDIAVSAVGCFPSNSNVPGFAEGHHRAEGQYLLGEESPDHSAYFRRVLISENCIYLDAVLGPAYAGQLELESLSRRMVIDLDGARVCVRDSFASSRALNFHTSLHCLGSIREVAPGLFRLTGGQANLLAGKKHGEMGMTDEEYGEVFVTLLNPPGSARVQTEAPSWFPSYIFGINAGPDSDPAEGRYPIYRRWKLCAKEAKHKGELGFCISPRQEKVRFSGNQVALPGGLQLCWDARRGLKVAGFRIFADAVVWNQEKRWIAAAGVTSLKTKRGKIDFPQAVDADLRIVVDRLTGKLYTHSNAKLPSHPGLRQGPPTPVGAPGDSHAPWQRTIRIGEIATP